MKNNRFFPLLLAFFYASLFSNLLVAQQFENTFGSLVNHEEPQDGKPIPNGRYIVLSNTLSYGPASRIMLTRLSATGAVNMNATIQEANTAYFGTSIDLDYNAAGTHTGYFIAGSRISLSGRQAILIRTNTSGTVTWTKVLPNADNSGSLDESGVSVERQSNGDVILTASGYSANANNHRFSVSRFNSAGNQLWSNRYYATTTGQNMEATEACNAVRSGVNVIVVTGRYRATGVANTRSFLSCINASTGVEIWRRSYDAGQNGDQGLDVVYKPANGNEAAALMMVGWSGFGHPTLWVVRANPLNGIASSKTYSPNVFWSDFSGVAISLDVTGTRAAITGSIVYQPQPGNLLSGTFAMVLPFYGTELPDWTYYYSSSNPVFTMPRGIAPITGATGGYLVTCGSRITGSAFNDAHAMRVSPLGATDPTGCEVAQIGVTRTVQGTSSWRAFSRIPYTWTNIFPARSPQDWTQEFCIEPQLGGIGEERSEELVEEEVVPQLFPNPVAAGQDATLAFDLPEAGKVNLVVFDLVGREVWSFGETLAEGQQALELPVSRWPKGAYFIQLMSPAVSKTLKFVVSGN